MGCIKGLDIWNSVENMAIVGETSILGPRGSVVPRDTALVNFTSFKDSVFPDGSVGICMLCMPIQNPFSR